MNKMLEPKSLDQLEHEVADWEANEVSAFLKKQVERKQQFFTIGDFPVKRVYTAADIADTPIEDIGLPGRYPFTRGPYPTMYRSRFWTMRQIAGFGTGEDTNKRFKFLISQGQTGPLHRLRYADADGLRLRPSDERRRGRPRRRRRRHARRHGGALRRHRSGENLGLDDHQSERLDPAGDVYRAWQKARLRSQQDVRHDPGRHLEGIHGAEGILLSDRALGAHRARLHHLLRRAHEALQPDQYFRLPHLRGRLFAAAGSRVHAGQRHRLRARRC